MEQKNTHIDLKVLFLFTVFSVLMATSVPIGYSEGHFFKHYFLSHAVIALALLVGLIHFGDRIRKEVIFVKKKSYFPFYFSGYFVAAIYYLSVLLLCSFFSPMPNHVQSYIYWFKQMLLPFLVSVLLCYLLTFYRSKIISLLYQGMLTSGLVFFLVALAEKVFPHFTRIHFLSDLRWTDSLKSYGFFFPVAGVFEHYNAFGVQQALCITLLLPYLFIDLRRLIVRKKIHRSLLIRTFLAICFVIGIALSTSKTAMMGLSTAFIYLLWKSRERLKINPRQIIKITTLFCSCILVTYALNHEARARLFILFQGGENKSYWNRIVDFFITGLQGRDVIYRWDTFLFLARPIQGYGVFQTNNALHSVNALSLIHPHNIIFLQLLEGGLLGFIGFLLLLLPPHLLLPKKFRQKATYRWLTGLQITFFTCQMTELFVSHILWYGLVYFGLISMQWWNYEQINQTQKK